MSTQRRIAAAFFSLIIVGVLAAIIYTDHVSATNTVPVYILNRDVVADTVMAEGDISQQNVRADDAQFQTAEARPIDQLTKLTRYVLSMKKHDILRQDDLINAATTAEVPITVRGDSSPGLLAGDRLDIYAFTGGQAVQVGHRIPVVAVGTPLVVGVPAEQEQFWVAMTFAKTDLLATRAGANALPPGMGLTDLNALCELSKVQAICQRAQAQGTPGRAGVGQQGQ